MKYLFATFFILFSFYLKAQDAISTDRPTQSAGATVVPKGSVLIEAGYINEKVTTGIKNLTYLNTLVRIGLIDNLELRLTQNYSGVNVLDEKANGLSPFTLGTKYHLLAADGWKPQMSVLGQVTLLTGMEEFRPESEIFEVRLNFQNSLSENASLGYNIGYTTADDQELFYTLVFGYEIVDGWTVFAEPYAFLGNNDHRFNAGLIYLAKPNLQFDFSFGSGLSDNAPDSFVGFGVALGL